MREPFQPDAELDRRLREIHRSEAPPEDLAGRILARAQARQRPWLHRHAPLLSLCSALLAVCVYFAIGVVHQRQIQARRAQEAQAHLLYALQITTGELHWAENRITQDMALTGKKANP